MSYATNNTANIMSRLKENLSLDVLVKIEELKRYPLESYTDYDHLRSLLNASDTCSLKCKLNQH